MKRLIAVLIVAVVGLGLVGTDVLARAPSGAIFTTLEDGTQVNANIYEFAEDVYLDGGPGPNAPADAAGLPEGIYIFQVTDPSGKVLLSTDDFLCRAFYVDASGVIADVLPGPSGCEHATGIDVDHGAATVQLAPFLETPNPGAEYKVWVTPAEAFDPDGTKYHGFVRSASKTDMFKILSPSAPPDEGPPDDID